MNSPKCRVGCSKKCLRLFSEGKAQLCEDRFSYLLSANWGKFQHIYRFSHKFSCCEKEKTFHSIEVILKDCLEGESWQYYFDSIQFLNPTPIRREFSQKFHKISQRKAQICQRIQSLDEYLPSRKPLHDYSSSTGSSQSTKG
nr:hypothetical protein pmam_297 [Pithovirus mammoth]